MVVFSLSISTTIPFTFVNSIISAAAHLYKTVPQFFRPTPQKGSIQNEVESLSGIRSPPLRLLGSNQRRVMLNKLYIAIFKQKRTSIFAFSPRLS